MALARLATGAHANHQRSEFTLLLADVEIHFRALTQTPEDVLRHIGSLFAPYKDTMLLTHSS